MTPALAFVDIATAVPPAAARCFQFRFVVFIAFLPSFPPFFLEQVSVVPDTRIGFPRP